MEMSAEEIAILKSSEREGIEKTQEMLQDIYDVWKEFNISEEQMDQRSRVVWVHIHNLVKDIRHEEQTFLKETKERILTYKNLVEKLRESLNVAPSKEAGPKSLVLIEESLRLEVDALNKIKQNREKKYKDLKDQESMLCRHLQMEGIQLSPGTEVPSEKDIKELEEQVKMLSKEKEVRYKKFCVARKELSTILELTELTPESPLEKEILSGSETFSLTKQNFKALEEVIEKAHQKKKELESKKQSLLDELVVLWSRLKVDKREQDSFRNKHEKCTLSNLKAIEQELNRCKEVKRENLKSFVCSLRGELQDLWKKCCISEKEKNAFVWFDDDTMTDGLLDLHEAEVEKWKQYYKDVEPILRKIEERKSLWELMLQLENKENDPNRFKNRGGNLLQEERQRKKIQHDLPNLEKHIYSDIEKFESDSGRTFLYYGEDYKEFVQKQWADRVSQKENEKIQRHLKNSVQSGLRPTPMKRPMGTTPKSAPSKLLKSTAGMSVYATPMAGTSKVLPHTISKPPRCPSGMKKTLFQQRTQMRVMKEQNKHSPDGTTYTDFAAELDRSSRRSLRSSVLCTKKPGGSRISKNKRKSVNKSIKVLKKSVKSAASSSTSRNPNGLTPVRGKLGLPFLI